jgi:FKBP-type peptidyl-prolyl cis-trans isomerase SlyD
MVIEKDKMVSLIYTLREADKEGKVIEQVEDSNPLQFLYGAGQMLPHFEQNLEGKKGGDNFEFGLTSGNAYGDKREELVVDIPRSVFEIDGKFDTETCRVGNQVPMADAEGRRLMGVVLEIKDELVAMDFNHPMAGVDLYFTGEIKEVREATADEIQMYYGGGSCSTCGSSNSCDGHC